MCKVIHLIFAASLCVHCAAIKVKSTLIILPFRESTKFLEQLILTLQELSVETTLRQGDYIISEEYSGFIVLFAAEDVDHTFLRQSTIVGRIRLLAGLTLNVISLAVVVYTKVRRVLSTIGLVFILQVMFDEQLGNFVLMNRIVLTVAVILKIQAVNKELIQGVGH